MPQGEHRFVGNVAEFENLMIARAVIASRETVPLGDEKSSVMQGRNAESLIQNAFRNAFQACCERAVRRAVLTGGGI